MTPNWIPATKQRIQARALSSCHFERSEAESRNLPPHSNQSPAQQPASCHARAHPVISSARPVISSEAKRSRETSPASLKPESCSTTANPGTRSPSSCHARSHPVTRSALILSFRAKRSGVEKSPRPHSNRSLAAQQRIQARALLRPVTRALSSRHALSFILSRARSHPVISSEAKRSREISPTSLKPESCSTTANPSALLRPVTRALSSCHFERSEAESRNLPGLTQAGVLQHNSESRHARPHPVTRALILSRALLHPVTRALILSFRAKRSGVEKPPRPHSSRSLAAQQRIQARALLHPVTRALILSFRAERSGVEKPPWPHSNQSLAAQQRIHALSFVLSRALSSCHFERSEAESRNLPGLTQTRVLQHNSESRHARSRPGTRALSCHGRALILSFRAKRSGVEKSPRPHSNQSLAAQQRIQARALSSRHARSPSSCHARSLILSFRAKRSGVEKSPRPHSNGSVADHQNHLETGLIGYDH